VIRLEQLRVRFEEERRRSGKRPSSPTRAISDESHPEIAALARELDEERKTLSLASEETQPPPSRGARAK
jgi:hypothetical protein